MPARLDNSVDKMIRCENNSDKIDLAFSRYTTTISLLSRLLDEKGDKVNKINLQRDQLTT